MIAAESSDVDAVVLGKYVHLGVVVEFVGCAIFKFKFSVGSRKRLSQVSSCII
jgi:hypothetical protein